MADENDLGANPENGFDGGDEPLPQVAILTQYVKDLSFENPNAPGSLQVQAQPRIDVNVGVNARKAADDVFEVELKISAKADVDGNAAFMVELLYAGLFGLKNVPEEALEPFCIIEAPRILFPFARRIIADAVRDGGFPPLMLDPIDFGQLYLAQQQQGQVGNA
ncbi:protein-export chaperone SecB [Sandarakinorhabdus rubra]|uniref:protein-export chaperone SecB n=1 Tax=Sandarakinorhabdus rubra TaxID=2672568 RepID=UPI001969C46A|nr:protein-export chaperone SecB [Sandarakinorhabdus rubra]